MRKHLVAASLLLFSCASVSAAQLLGENFADISTLAGNGWVLDNRSVPTNPDPEQATDWFQGNDGVFVAQSAPDNSYIAANWLNAGYGGNVDNWLITPTLSLAAGDTISFYTRSAGAVPGDSLRLAYSAGGTSIGDFTNFGLIDVADYPTDWTQFVFTYSGPTAAAGRIALRYQVTDTEFNGDYIGIDTLSIDSVPVPLPSSVYLLATALLLAPLVMRRRFIGSSAAAA